MIVLSKISRSKHFGAKHFNFNYFLFNFLIIIIYLSKQSYLMEKNSRQYQSLKRNLSSLLRDFERNRQWADIGNWLYRLKEVLGDKKFKQLPCSNNLSKRLAQCLNPNLPAGIHSTALSIYTIVLSNFENRYTILPLLSIGLFPFFECSSSQLKLQLINIFETYFIGNHESLQMIISLMNALLCGLNEINRQLQKKIEQLFDKIINVNGPTWVDGAVWVNILRSPKVRKAGFTYFMKVFKDRDKKKNSQEYKSQQAELNKILKEQQGQITSPQIQKQSRKQSFQQELRQQLNKMKIIDDQNQNRFPNFSTLVINAMLACLQSTDSQVKKSALDMMIAYIKLNNQDLVNEQDAIILTQAILKLLRLKEYPLTRRVYIYLFGPPNMEGVYIISPQQQKYQLQIIKASLKRILIKKKTNDKKQSQNNLMIIEALLLQHTKLVQILLPDISYWIVKHIESNLRQKQSKKIISEFYTKIIQNSKQTFVEAILKQLSIDKKQEEINQLIETLYFYFENIEKCLSSNAKTKAEQSKSFQQKISLASYAEIVFMVIDKCLQFCEKTNFQEEKLCVSLLELCHSLYGQLITKHKMDKKLVQRLNYLVQTKPNFSVYGGLIQLHPLPRKQYLLPYIDQGYLGIICLKNLLNLQLQDQTQITKIFFSIFKVLNCHLWEDIGIDYIKIFYSKYPEHFLKNIDEVEVTQWLIYWRKLNGDVHGGVIRMIRLLNNESPLMKHLSKKWINQSNLIIGKIIDPFFKYVKDIGLSATIDIYSDLQNIFNSQNQDFVKYFFFQKQRYLRPIIGHMFQCLDSESKQFRSETLNMMQFILRKTNTTDQKAQFISLTLFKILNILQQAVSDAGYLQEVELLSYLRSLIQTFPAFEKITDKREKIYILFQQSDIFRIVASGMFESTISYSRTLYIDFMHDLCNLIGYIDTPQKTLTSKLINAALKKLFVMLKHNDITILQQIIQGRQVSSRRKKSQTIVIQNVSINDMNLEAKYAQIIELWNSVKFYIKFSIKSEIKTMPILEIISIILQSFPFAGLQYCQFQPEASNQQYEKLQEKVANITGLKKQVLEIFQILWHKHQCSILDVLIEKGDPKILIHACVDPALVVRAISRSTYIKQLKSYAAKVKINLPKGTMHYNLQNLKKQNQICYFFYLFLMYCNLGLIRNKKISDFIENTLNLMKNLKNSSHAQIKIWLIEIIYCMSQRVSLRDLQTDNPNIKFQLNQLAKELIDQIVSISLRKRKFTHRTEIKTGFIASMFSRQQKQTSLFDFIQPFTPTLYKLKRLAKFQSYSSTIQAVEDYTEIFLFAQWQNRDQDDFISYLGVVAIKTLIQVSCEILNNLNQKQPLRVCPNFKKIIKQILPVFENKDESNQMYIEMISEYLHKILDFQVYRPQVMKSLRAGIIQVFMANDFFKCTKKSLNHWKAIIDYCAESHDLLIQLLGKEGLFEGIFTSKNQSVRLKIKSFERVCFVIYAGRIDKYQNELWKVFQSLNKVMREENPSPSLLILILFCVRILFLRLSQASLSRMFRSIWPGIIILLVQIFSKEKGLTKNTNLLLAGLKVIELVHALQLQQFHLHQWMFVFDYFGIRLDPGDLIEENKQQQIITPFQFKPYLTSVLPKLAFKCNFIPQKNVNKLPTESIKRKIIIKQSSLYSQQQLRNHAFVLMQYIIDLNQMRVYVTKQQIQQLIEADFICLDDYIFNVK